MRHGLVSARFLGASGFCSVPVRYGGMLGGMQSNQSGSIEGGYPTLESRSCCKSLIWKILADLAVTETTAHKNTS